MTCGGLKTKPGFRWDRGEGAETNACDGGRGRRPSDGTGRPECVSGPSVVSGEGGVALAKGTTSAQGERAPDEAIGGCFPLCSGLYILRT